MIIGPPPKFHGTRDIPPLNEVCTELRIARSTWEKWRQKDAGPKVVKLPNGQLRIRSDWLDTWIDEQPPMSV